jgi:hypothetical protein
LQHHQLEANMPIPQKSSKAALEACESMLGELRASRVADRILPSEVAVIDRMLDRSLELADAYDELYHELNDHPQALHVFFDQLLAVAAFWNPEANREARQYRTRLLEVNHSIETRAAELAELVDERTELKNHSGFSCDTHYHPIDLIHAAAKRNYTYQQWVKGRLQEVTGQFDLKYWPTIGDLLRALADDAAQAEPKAHDAVTEAGTEGNRPALADTFRAFFVALEEAGARNFGFIPREFDLTDRSVASLLSCALGLGADETVDSSYVKRLRQRQREKSGAP